MKRWAVFLMIGALGCSTEGEPGDDLETFEHDGGTLSEDETWLVGRHVLENTLTLNASLTVEACSIVEMPLDGAITISSGGALKLLGTEDCPVTVTSSNEEPSPGDWRGIEVYGAGQNAANVIEHAVIEYAGSQSQGAVWVGDGASIAMSNTTVRHSENVALEVWATGEVREFSDITLTQNGGHPLEMAANDAGQIQSGDFTGNADDYIFLLFDDVEHDQTWADHGVPYESEGFGVETASGSAHLTIAAGVELRMEPDASIDVGENGGLHLAGTAAAPVSITSNQGEDAQAGDWGNIDIYASSDGSANVFTHAVIRHAGSTYGAIWVDGGASVAITDSTFTDNDHSAVQAAGADAELRDFTGNTFNENRLGALVLDANVVGDVGANTFLLDGDNDGIVVNYSTVDHSTTWLDHGVPYFSDGFQIDASSGAAATLTLAAGVVLYLDSDAYLSADPNGRLVLAGESGKRVTITTDDVPPAAGSWNTIELWSAGNVFSYADISYGGGSSFGQLWLDGDASVTMTDVDFSHSGMACDVYASFGADVIGDVASSYVVCP